MSVEEIEQYLAACGYTPDELISVNHKTVSGAMQFKILTVAKAPRVIDGLRLVDCWISAAVIRRPAEPESRGSIADVERVPALWADLDVGPRKIKDYATARAVVEELSTLIGATPCALVASGHGLQPRWRVSGDVDSALMNRFGVTVQRIARAHGGKADSVFDLARIVRAPGTTNCKDRQHKIQVRTKCYPDAATVTAEHLAGVLDAIDVVAPVVQDTPAAVEVNLDRGNAYAKAAVAEITSELRAIHDWPLGKTDERGRGWEKRCADGAYRLAELARAEWNELTLTQARRLFVEAAPTDDGAWSVREVIKKWNSQARRAGPALAPPTVTDPLAPGYAATPSVEAAPLASDGPPAAELIEDDVVAPAEPVEDDVAAFRWRKFSWDDKGNAERIAAMFGDELRWSPTTKTWLRYENGAWRETEDGGARCAIEMIDQLLPLELELYSDEERREGRKVTSDRIEFGKFWEGQRFDARYRAAARVLATTGLVTALHDEFDTEPMLLNARNVVVNLETGGAVPHDARLMLKKQAPVVYDPLAEAPKWEAFIRKVMPSVDMQNYLQRVIGYSITGMTSEQAVFMHHGVTNNGKSVMLRVVSAMLGEFGRVVPPTTLLTKRNEAHPTDIMGMEGRRFLQVSELPAGARLEEATIKRLSGEEVITARGMGQDFRDFSITGKIHMVTNPLPHIDDDKATHRRLHLINWPVTITPEERDPFLARDIIRDELPGVLAWAVRGALEWQKYGLGRPVEAEMESAEYFHSEDEFGEFIDTMLVRTEGSDARWTETNKLFLRYAQHTESMRGRPMSKIAFSRKLSARGFEVARTKTARGFRAIFVDETADYDPFS